MTICRKDFEKGLLALKIMSGWNFSRLGLTEKLHLVGGKKKVKPFWFVA
jgi:hypothetical protein